MDKRDEGGGGGGVSRFSVRIFLSHSAENFRRVTLLCCVSENFRKPKSLWIRGGGEHQVFRRKFFCLTVPKILVGEPLSVSLISGNFWQGSDSNPQPTAWEHCCPKLTAVIYFWIKRVGNFGLKKKEKRPYWMNIFSCILHTRRKIKILLGDIWGSKNHREWNNVEKLRRFKIKRFLTLITWLFLIFKAQVLKVSIFGVCTFWYLQLNNQSKCKSDHFENSFICFAQFDALNLNLLTQLWKLL